MERELLTDLDVVLAQLRAMMLMNYGGTLLNAQSDTEKHEAFISLMSSGIDIIAAAVTSRKQHEEAMRITLDQFPSMLRESVNAKLELIAKVEAGIERDGATVQ